MKHLLAVQELVIEYETDVGPSRALDGATLQLDPGEWVALVGESGSGKSTLGLAIGRLLPKNAHPRGGALLVDGRSIFDMPADEVQRLRRRALAFIFQDAVGSLDPTMRIGRQVAFAAADAENDRPPSEHLARVGLSQHILAAYPHELSGGMAQRVAIAIAMAGRPRFIIADEPTASLDATIRRQILELLFGLARDEGAAVLLLTHDLRSVQRYCRRVAVVYGGRVVEDGPVSRVFQDPRHPYTRALLASAVGWEVAGRAISPIAGAPPVLRGPSTGCVFAPRCGQAISRCITVRPVMELVEERRVICHRAAEPSSPADASEEVDIDA